jgi:hypothetical protein
MAVAAMLWVAAAALLLFVAPAIVAAVEEAWRTGPRDVGFWTVARAVGGTCHVPWGRRGSPVVLFPLPDGEARLRALRTPPRRGWTIEARAYQRKPFRFAARLCAPPSPPVRWRAPGLAPLELFPGEAEHLASSSLETTDERLLRWLLRHAETRRRVDGLLEETRAAGIEVVLGGGLVLVRAHMRAGIPAGTAVEMAGPPLVTALRRLSADLDDLADALDESEGGADGALCPTCWGELGEDPALCKACGARGHRGCREMVGGCVSAACGAAPDAAPGVRLEREAA